MDLLKDFTDRHRRINFNDVSANLAMTRNMLTTTNELMTFQSKTWCKNVNSLINDTAFLAQTIGASAYDVVHGEYDQPSLSSFHFWRFVDLICHGMALAYCKIEGSNFEAVVQACTLNYCRVNNTYDLTDDAGPQTLLDLCNWMTEIAICHGAYDYATLARIAQRYFEIKQFAAIYDVFSRHVLRAQLVYDFKDSKEVNTQVVEDAIIITYNNFKTGDEIDLLDIHHDLRQQIAFGEMNVQAKTIQ